MFWIKLLVLLAMMNPGAGTCLSGDCENGYGKYVFHDGGTIYQGQFTEGKFNGSGILDLNGGTKYVGLFKDGFYHGEGSLTLPDGTSFQGMFEMGRLKE